jgi:integrase
VAIPWATHWATCPARLALTYVKRQPAGPLFRHIDRHGRTHDRLRPGAAVTDRLRLLVAHALLEVEPERYSSHSLRAGFATAAEDAGADPSLIARHLRHKPRNRRSRDMRQVYDRPASLFARSPFDPSWS